MSKKILSGLFTLALLAATGYGVNQSMKNYYDHYIWEIANLPEPSLCTINLKK